LVTAASATSLAGLAQAGDRLTKLTLTFVYASTEPDVALSLVAGDNFREVQTVYRYMKCDAGREAGLDTSTIVDAGSEGGRDIGDDVVRTEAGARPDADPDVRPPIAPDAGGLAGADAGVPLLPDARTHANPDPVPPEHRGGGCSVSGTSPAGDWILWALLVVGLACRACAASRKRDRDWKMTR
jgi:hypothetical protein